MEQELNILLVEDHEDDAELVLHALRREGLRARWRRVETREAYLASLSPDLDVILADFALPQFDGLEALRLLHERNLDIPFILVSGTIGEEAAVRAMRAGASDYLLKDRLGRLPTAVRAVLREQRLRRERQEAAVALRESEERYRRLVEHSPAPIAVHIEGRFAYLNPAAVALLGAREAGQLLGHSLLDYVHKDSLPFVAHSLERMMQTGEPEPAAEMKLVRLDGAIIYCVVSSAPVTFHGRPAIQLTGHDFTERRRAQEAYQKLVDESLQGILIIQGGRAVFCNRAFADMLGYSPEELLSFSSEEMARHVYPEDRKRVAEYHVWRMAGKPAPTRYEFRILRADGAVRWLHASVSHTLHSGQPAAQAYYVDITERKQAEEAEREQRRYAEALADSAAVLNSSLQPETVLERILANVGRVLPHDAADVCLVRDGVTRVVGSRGYEALGLKAIIDTMALTVAETPMFRQMAETGQPLIISDINTSDLWVGERLMPLRSVLGAPIQIEGELAGFINIASLMPNAFDESDAARLQAFANQTATALRNARLYRALQHYSERLERMVAERTAELRQTKESVEAILDSIGEGVVVLNAEGKILQVNPALEAQTGYREAEMVGHSYEELLKVTLLDGTTMSEVLQTVGEGKPWEAETTISRRDGTTYDAALTVARLQQNGEQGAGAFVASVRDITRMKEVERMKDSVLSIAAHELRTPLTTMNLYADMLANRMPQSKERRERAQKAIHQQTLQLQRIVDDMLDLARLEAGRGLEIVPRPLQVRHLLEEVVRPIAETTENHEVRLEEVPPWLAVHGDRLRLMQVVRNLLSNAVKYSPDGGTITISARQHNGCVQVSVSDEGIGISPEEQQHLFEKFYRADTGRDLARGTGLGLPICKLIVEGHGGRIHVHSEKGKGSTFTFSVPAAPQ